MDHGLAFPKRDLTPAQEILYSKILSFLELNVHHAIQNGLDIFPPDEQLRLELRIMAETSDDIAFRFNIEATLP